MSCRRTISAQLVQLAHDRHHRVREIADEADQLDAVRVAPVERAGEPCGLFARAQAEHAQRALGRARAMLAHVPAGHREEAEQGGCDEPERVGARVQESSSSDDECRHERGGLGMTDESNSQRAVVLTAIAQEGRTDHPRDTGRGDCRDEPGRRSTEGEPPGEQRDPGESELRAALPSKCERTRRQRHRVGDDSGVRCAWVGCHGVFRCSWVA